jgi:hypothetical protein
MSIVESDNGYAIEVDPEHHMFGWVFRPGPNPGQWVSLREASVAELGSALRRERNPSGIKVRVDPTMPKDEVRLEQDGQVLGIFKIEGLPSEGDPR